MDVGMMKQKTECVWLYLNRLKGAARQCNINLPIGQTSYIDKMVKHTLVQGMEDALIARGVLEEYATKRQTPKPPHLQNIKKLIAAKESANRSMTELTRTHEELHGTTNKVTTGART